MRVDHLSSLFEGGKDLIIPVAPLQVLVSSLIASTNKEDLSILGSNGPAVEGNFKLHLDWPLLEVLVLQSVNIGILLVPLEGVHLLGDIRLEAVLHVVVYAEVRVDQVREVFQYLRLIFIEESLELTDVLIFVEELLKLGIEVHENLMVVVKDLKELVLAHLIGVLCCLLKLSVLLAEPGIEARDLDLVIVDEGIVLLLDHLVEFSQKLLLVAGNGLLSFEEDLAELLRQFLFLLAASFLSLLKVLLHILEVTIDVLELSQGLRSQVLLGGQHVLRVDCNGQFVGGFVTFFTVLLLHLLQVFG
mmetsp:Transcript_16974/g.26139  ORF Transcript_16974/g.26139 Transcript_16974/m.26139 type:complete len:303 (+) Transcript_16974:652-1560(+)